MQTQMERIMKITDLLINNKNMSKLAVVDHGISYSYNDIYKITLLKAAILSRLFSERSHIAILLPNSADYIIAYYSILFSDNVVIPIFYKSTLSEIENTINNCDICAIITTTEDAKRIKEGHYAHTVTIINADNYNYYNVGNQEKVATPESPDNVAVMLGTSGSTGISKRVMLSHNNLISNAASIVSSLNYNENEKILCILPFTFASGNTSQLIVSLLLSSTLYIYDDILHPGRIFSAIEKHKITTTTIVPSILKLLLSDKENHVEQCHSLKVICFGGGPTDAAISELLLKSPLKNKFVHMYGQTEASTRISHLSLEKEAEKFPSVGKPLEGIEVKIDRISSEENNGEILVRGKNVMLGYYKSTLSPIDNGWLATGDIGYTDNNGYIYITGRKKNIIISSGINIYPEEVENVLCMNEAVSEALVYGVNDEAHGELPVADVVLNKDSKISQNDLIRFCKKHLSEYKVPTQIFFVPELKRTYNGKVERKHLT